MTVGAASFCRPNCYLCYNRAKLRRFRGVQCMLRMRIDALHSVASAVFDRIAEATIARTRRGNQSSKLAGAL